MDSEWEIAKITSKRKKNTGKYWGWLNIKRIGNNGASNIDWKVGVKKWHVAESEENLENLIYNLKHLSIDENEKLSFSRKAFSEIKVSEIQNLQNWKIGKEIKFVKKFHVQDKIA